MLVRNNWLRKITQFAPPEFRSSVCFLERKLAFPLITGEINIDTLIDGLVVLMPTMHHRERHEILFTDNDPKLFGCFANRRSEETFTGFDMTGGTTRPVPIHETGTLSQLKQHLPLSVETSSENHVYRGYQGKAHRLHRFHAIAHEPQHRLKARRILFSRRAGRPVHLLPR
ncbi:hypothetical protein SAMN05421595_2919 [Austwickia chelonae]|uniref:Uncharacterized protein n=1 Tax=Austwickia chelonae NBRC 105200 TaxID=1184607 RepID=K6VQR3_9MICO|nr:hypothetical protein AUCHE_18_00600 [Austwickia chelonae NBRC 105200]SEW41965.1 hypothetical protein SAMN05421595_2919 [Austwickia chelonae]